MATPFTFSVTLDNGKKVKVRTMRPVSCTDPEWSNKVVGDVDAAVNDMAHQKWVILVQAPCRKAKDETEAQSIHDRYQYGIRGGGVAAPELTKEDKEEGEFSEAQLAILAKRGMKV